MKNTKIKKALECLFGGVMFTCASVALTTPVIVSHKISQHNRVKGYVRPLFENHYYRIDTPFEKLDSAEKVDFAKEEDRQKPYLGAFLYDYNKDGNKDLIYDSNGVTDSSVKYCKIKYGKNNGTFSSAEIIENIDGAFKAVVSTLP